MHAARITLRFGALGVLGSVLLGCPTEESGPQAPARARARADDPPLTHRWNISLGASRVVRGDLGSTPPALADALMQDGTLPSLIFRLAEGCETAKAMPPTAGELALRLKITKGALATVQGDPEGPLGKCLESAARAEHEVFAPLPDGVALVRLEISAPVTESKE